MQGGNRYPTMAPTRPQPWDGAGREGQEEQGAEEPDLVLERDRQGGFLGTEEPLSAPSMS